MNKNNKAKSVENCMSYSFPNYDHAIFVKSQNEIRKYQSIIKKKAIKMTYQSFKAKQASSFDFHPYLLKEFRNKM